MAKESPAPTEGYGWVSEGEANFDWALSLGDVPTVGLAAAELNDVWGEFDIIDYVVVHEPDQLF